MNTNLIYDQALIVGQRSLMTVTIHFIVESALNWPSVMAGCLAGLNWMTSGM